MGTIDKGDSKPVPKSNQGYSAWDDQGGWVGAAIFLPAHLKEAQMLRPPLRSCLHESFKITILMQIMALRLAIMHFHFTGVSRIVANVKC